MLRKHCDLHLHRENNVSMFNQPSVTNRHENQNFNLLFNGQNIPAATTHKHLGLMLSTDLHFHEHINTIIRTINTTLGPIYPVAKYLPRSILTTYTRHT